MAWHATRASLTHATHSSRSFREKNTTCHTNCRVAKSISSSQVPTHFAVASILNFGSFVRVVIWSVMSFVLPNSYNKKTKKTVGVIYLIETMMPDVAVVVVS